MNEVHKCEFLRLAKLQEKLKEQLGEVTEELNKVLAEVPVGTYTQDDETGLVYKVVKPKGTFMYYKDLDYVRTAKAGEKGGTVLSKSEAEANGFVLRK